MILNENKLQKAVYSGLSVFGFFSADINQLEYAAKKTIHLLDTEKTEIMRLDGPAPLIEDIVPAVGMISFFSNKRIVYLSMLRPNSYSENDLSDLCEVISDIENSLLIITCPISEVWGKPKLNKAEKKLLDICEKIGQAYLLTSSTEAELSKMVRFFAAQQKTEISANAISRLIDFYGQDTNFLQNEVAKLAAYANYSQITLKEVDALSTRNLDADVFQMSELLNRGETAAALRKLDILLRLQNDPIAICAALSVGYLDMYRLCCARSTSCTNNQIAKDFGYRNVNRLNKKQRIASKIGKERLRCCLDILIELDRQLKSVPDNRKEIITQTAICSLAATHNC